MKKVFAFVLVALMVAGCEKAVVDEVVVGESRAVRFDVSNGGWTVTRSLEADGKAMTDLWVWDYVDDVCVGMVHKTEGDADMDAPTLQMSFGRHRVYFVASRGKSAVVNGETVTWGSLSDTFWKAVDVEVTRGQDGDVPVVLERVATRLVVKVTDRIPDGVATLCVRPSAWWCGLDYTSGVAMSMSDEVRQVAVPASFAGTEGRLSAAFFGMSDVDGWLCDLDIYACDADDNVLGSVTVKDVPFDRNRQTVVSGALFADGRGFSVSLGDEWKDEYVVEW